MINIPFFIYLYYFLSGIMNFDIMRDEHFQFWETWLNSL